MRCSNSASCTGFDFYHDINRCYTYNSNTGLVTDLGVDNYRRIKCSTREPQPPVPCTFLTVLAFRFSLKD